MRLIHIPIYAGGQPTSGTVELAAAIPLVAVPEHVRWLGYRLIVTARGRLAVERLH